MREEFIQAPVFNENLPFDFLHGGISYCDGSYLIERKKSNIAVVEYVISGHGTVKTRNNTFYPHEGDTYLLLPGEEHYYFSSSDDPWIKIWINISGKIVTSLIDVYSLRSNTVFHCDSQRFIQRIHEIIGDKSLTPNEISEKSSIVFHELMQFLANNKPVTKTVSPDAQQLKNYIDSNIYQQITIDDLAKLIYKSPAHTIRIFKKAYGITPYDYYMDNRIKKAISLLEDTNLSVKEIAFMLDFCDEHYFSNIFRQKTGKKPTDYR